MKLLLCRACSDVFKLWVGKTRTCHCGKVSGAYLDDDDLHAWYSGESAVPLGFQNISLVAAIRDQPAAGNGQTFRAFVIPKTCPTFGRREPTPVMSKSKRGAP